MNKLKLAALTLCLGAVAVVSFGSFSANKTANVDVASTKAGCTSNTQCPRYSFCYWDGRVEGYCGNGTSLTGTVVE